MKTELLNMIDTIALGIEKIKPLLATYVKDSENFSLEDRWEIYSKAPASFFAHNGYYQGYEFGGEEIVWYDDHNIDRYQTADNVQIVKSYENRMNRSGWCYDETVTQEKIDNLKEQMLQSGCRTWENDW